MHKIKLKIADVIIEMKSEFAFQPPERKDMYRYRNFIYKGRRAADICFEVNLTELLPLLSKYTERIFLTRHFQDNDENWALFKSNGKYILRDYVDQRKRHLIITGDFSRIKAYISVSKNEQLNWYLDDIIYDVLQIILIHYLSKRGGLFVHAVGIKDRKGRGLLFTGKSGSGKSTTARLWHKHSRDKVLNDDRIIVRRINNRLYMYGSPWHGTFSDYLATRTDRARLKNLFFIFHSKKNKLSVIKKNVFRLLYPCLFPPFWDRSGLEHIIYSCSELIKKVPCFRLGFKNTKEVIGFVRRIKY